MSMNSPFQWHYWGKVPMGIIPITIPIIPWASVQVNISTQIGTCLMNFVRFVLYTQQDAAAVTEWTLSGSWWQVPLCWLCGEEAAKWQQSSPWRSSRGLCEVPCVGRSGKEDRERRTLQSSSWGLPGRWYLRKTQNAQKQFSKYLFMKLSGASEREYEQWVRNFINMACSAS